MTRLAALFLAMILIGPGPVAALGGPTQQQEQDVPLMLGATEVLVDVVVKDQKGRPVTDLRPDDFEVFEDGERQTLQSVRLIRGGREAAEPGAGAAGAGPDLPSAGSSLQEIGAVAIVFDRLSTDSRRRARKAALEFLGAGLDPKLLVGVFATDLSLEVLQPYTSDLTLVREAVEGTGVRGSTSHPNEMGRIGDVADRQAALERVGAATPSVAPGSGPAASAAAGAAAAEAAATAPERIAAEMTIRSLESFQRLERDQQGYATTNGLLSVISSLGRLPGRKTLILFSEGLSIPPNVLPHFRAVISGANRSQVSIYTVDAAGLRTESPTAGAVRELTAMSERRMRQIVSGKDDTSGPMSRSLERNEDLVRLDPRSGLGQLAGETGGFLVSDTNDVGKRLRQINEDVQTYYAVTYAPKNERFDGSFRRVSVKVKRSGVEVQSRQGYFALGAFDSSPVLSYEAPALAVLGSGRKDRAFPLEALGLSFPEPEREGRSAVLVKAPASAFEYRVDEKAGIYSGDFSVVVLVRDASGQVVERLGQHFQPVGAEGELEQFKRGEVLFYRELTLAPGRYTVDAVGHDARSGKASVSSKPLVVPEAAPGALRMSDVVVVARGERIGAGAAAGASPFQVGEVLLYPSFDGRVDMSESAQLPFFVTVYPAGSDPVALTVEIVRDGSVVGRVEVPMPAADGSGRIQFANALPLAGVGPGEYVLRLTAVDARGRASRSTRFTVVP